MGHCRMLGTSTYHSDLEDNSASSSADSCGAIQIQNRSLNFIQRLSVSMSKIPSSIVEQKFRAFVDGDFSIIESSLSSRACLPFSECACSRMIICRKLSTSVHTASRKYSRLSYRGSKIGLFVDCPAHHVSIEIFATLISRQVRNRKL